MTTLTDLTVQSDQYDDDNGYLPNLHIRTVFLNGQPGNMGRDGSPKVYARGGYVAVDKDDSVDWCSRSYTRDGNGDVTRITGGTIIGRWYWQSPHPTSGEWYGPNGSNNRAGELLGRENDNGSGELVVTLRRPGFDNAVEAVRFHAAEHTGNNTPISVMKNGAGGAVQRRVKFARVQDLPANAQVLYVDP